MPDGLLPSVSCGRIGSQFSPRKPVSPLRRISEVKAQLAANERQVVDIFRRRRAVTIRAAKSLADLGLNNSQVLQSMVSAAIVRRAGPERFFLDEGAWAQRRSMSGTNARRLGIALAFVLAAVAYWVLV